MKKILGCIFILLPSFAHADRLGALKSGADVALTTQTVSAGVAYSSMSVSYTAISTNSLNLTLSSATANYGRITDNTTTYFSMASSNTVLTTVTGATTYLTIGSSSTFNQALTQISSFTAFGSSMPVSYVGISSVTAQPKYFTVSLTTGVVGTLPIGNLTTNASTYWNYPSTGVFVANSGLTSTMTVIGGTITATTELIGTNFNLTTGTVTNIGISTITSAVSFVSTPTFTSGVVFSSYTTLLATQPVVISTFKNAYTWGQTPVAYATASLPSFINGFNAGMLGANFTLFNISTANIFIVNGSTFSTQNARISLSSITTTGTVASSVYLSSGDCMSFIYDQFLSFWRQKK